MKLKQSEKDIQNAILEYLSAMKIFAWSNDTTGIYDPIRKSFRLNPRKMKGVADIIAVLPFSKRKGRILTIEVKSEKGAVSEHQKIFLERIIREGGEAMVARSVGDVMLALEKIRLQDRTG